MGTDLENTSHLEVHEYAYAFDVNDKTVIKKSSSEDEAILAILFDWNKGLLGELDRDGLLKVLQSINPYSELDIVYFEGILTTRVGASTTLKKREDELKP